jgi:hypothetical protein
VRKEGVSQENAGESRGCAACPGVFGSGGGLDPRFDFPLLDRVALRDLLPAADHGPGVGGQAVAGCDHVDVHDEEGEDGKAAGKMRGSDEP